MFNINMIKNEAKINGKIVETIKCKNPRCITSIEYNAPQLFYMVDKQKGEYRCEYCDEIHTA
jgi:aspartate carbamoyltransferase regulatory subunit